MLDKLNIRELGDTVVVVMVRAVSFAANGHCCTSCDQAWHGVTGKRSIEIELFLIFELMLYLTIHILSHSRDQSLSTLSPSVQRRECLHVRETQVQTSRRGNPRTAIPSSQQIHDAHLLAR